MSPRRSSRNSGPRLMPPGPGPPPRRGRRAPRGAAEPLSRPASAFAPRRDATTPLREPGGGLGHFVPELEVVAHAPGVEGPGVHRFPHRAARLAPVPAVAEAADGGQRLDVG